MRSTLNKYKLTYRKPEASFLVSQKNTMQIPQS